MRAVDVGGRGRAHERPPAVLRPDLRPVEVSDDDDLAVEPGVLAQVLRDDHPPLLVRRDLRGGGHEDPEHVLVEGSSVDLCSDAVGRGIEALDRPEAEAPVGHAHHARLAEQHANLGRQDHAALVVQSVLVGPDESGPLLCHGSPAA